MKTQSINVKLRLVFSITIFFIWFCGTAQTTYWKEEVSRNIPMGKSLKSLKPSKVKTYRLEKDVFLAKLQTVSKSSRQSELIYFPGEDGKFMPFKVVEKSIMAPKLAAKFPSIKSYIGESLDGSGSKVRFSVSHKGLQVMVSYVGEKPPTFMQKTSKDSNIYVSYSRNAEDQVEKDFICTTQSGIEKGTINVTAKLVDGQVLRKLRLAVSATGEYTDYHGSTVADALAAINATVTRINEVFERDLAVTLELVSNNDQVIFTNKDTDPYGTDLNSQVQSTLTTTIGEANYDIGHLFHEAPSGGDAGFIGEVCTNNRKGSAFAASPNPEGDIFDLDFVAHEMGHQLGANHTWSFQSEGTGVQAEPASGNTIMGYAGIVQGNNVQPNGDDYFHYYSISQILDNLETKSCPELITLTNTPPVIDPIGNFTIPKSTAFLLSATANDVDAGDELTYTWEQIDDGVVVTSTFGPDNPSGANFKSLPPSVSPERYFPRLSRVVQGALTQTSPTTNSVWETISNVPREFNFALTVRDNGISGGQVAAELVNVSMANNAGPFVVTSQAANENYAAGSIQEIVWDVAGTDVAPVNAKNVDILLSTDGGLTFPLVLADGVPNDGSHSVLLPGVATSNARIMVRASDNIFLAVNSANFIIEETQVVLNFDTLNYEVCTPDDLVVPFTYETYMGFNESVTFSASGVPAGLTVAFSPTTATANTTVDITFSNTASVPLGDYPVTIIATSASVTKQVELNLSVYDTNFSAVNLTSPADASADVSIDETLTWDAVPNTTSYDIEIATDLGFTNVLVSETVFSNLYIPAALTAETEYFWRVKPKNDCGEGVFSSPFSFTTIQVNCKNRSARNLPEPISPIGTPTIVSKITFLEDLKITDLNVNLNVTHSFLEDLVIKLTSPSGNTAVLVSSSCGPSRNINATFDDSGTAFVCSGTPALRGTIKPLIPLSIFNGESLRGEWILEIVDNQPDDGGSLNEFSLDACVEGMFRPDEDNDGVFDDGDDLCLGTPLGVEVNTDGCPVYRFAQDNFEIEINSEVCRENNDGSLKIEAEDTSINYAITVIGNGVNESSNFTAEYELGQLSAGEYDVCITGTLGAITYEPMCFEVVITQPDILGVTSKISEDGKRVALTFSGSNFYNIQLNGILQQTDASALTLNLKNGPNSLKISTNLPCQGIYEEEIFGFLEPVLYPNPVINTAKIYVGSSKNELQVSMYGLDGRYISSKKYPVNQNEIELDFVNLPAGIYIIRLDGLQTQKTFKVQKK